MLDADTLKVARDGQLSYGKPDRLAKMRRDCAAAGHRGIIEYEGGDQRCDWCLQFVPRDSSLQSAVSVPLLPSLRPPTGTGA